MIFDAKTREREFNVFEKIKDYYRRYIITNDTLNYSEKGIRHINIMDFFNF